MAGFVGQWPVDTSWAGRETHLAPWSASQIGVFQAARFAGPRTRRELSMASEGRCEPAAHLDGQVALVTGGGRGIGRAIALHLCESGASVAVCARSEDEVNQTAREITARQGRAIALQAGVSRRPEVERMVAEVEGSLGPVDLLAEQMVASASDIVERDLYVLRERE